MASAIVSVGFACLAFGGSERTAQAAPPDGSSEAGSEAAPAELEQPRLLNDTEILYPPELLEAAGPAPEGTVLLQFVVGVDGVPKEIQVVEGIHPELDVRAIDAVGKLRYEPGRFKGDPVEIVLRTAIEIVAPEKRAEEPETPVEAAEGTGAAGESAEDGDGVEDAEDAELGPVRIRGRIREAGDRGPVQGATVLAVPAPEGYGPGRIRKTLYEAAVEPEWSVRAVSDAEGRFELRGVPEGLVRVIVLSQGFGRLDYVERLEADEELDIEYYQTRLVSNPYRTVVDAKRKEPEVTRRTITAEEINNLPGTQGDALKAIQNFPGVARAPFGAGLLVVRGSAPSDSKVYLGYHEIPQLFHFGALTSVFNSDILAQIDFIPGNFDPRFGDAIGGIINVQPRKGRRSFHGYIDSDVFDTGIMLEGPIGKGSFILSGRRSYIDALLPLAIPDDADIDFEVAPRYWDYQALFDHPLAGGELSVRVFGSDDRLEVIAPDANEEEGDLEDTFGTVILFHRADIVYRKQEGPWTFLITPSYRHDKATAVASDVFAFKFTTDTLSTRAELTRQFSKRAALRVGTEIIGGNFKMDARAPAIPNVGEGSTPGRLGGVMDQNFVLLAPYTTATIAATPRFTLYPGVRVTSAPVIFEKTAVDPRARFAWEVGESTTLKGGVGMFSQLPDAPEWNEIWGNPGLQMERGVHTSFGIARVFDDWGVNAEATLFHKYLYDLAYPSTNLILRDNGEVTPERFASTGEAHVAGMEFLLRKNLTKNFFGWVSYTFSRAFYQWQPQLQYVPFDFDQPHILTAIAVYKFPRNWQLGARFRLVSGNPQDPIVNGVDDYSSGGSVPLIGPDNSSRAPAFHQLDVRVDKKWVFRKLSFSLYLDIQNIYNRRNFEAWNYSYDWQQKVVVAGLPIIPSLGLRAEF